MAQQQSKNRNPLQNTASTKPITSRVPPKNPSFQFNKPSFNNPKFMPQSFRNQNRGSGGK